MVISMKRTESDRLVETNNTTFLQRSMNALLGTVIGVLKVVVYPVLNIMLAALFVVSLVAKALSLLPIPFLGMHMGPVPGLGESLLDGIRFLAHRILIPSSTDAEDKVRDSDIAELMRDSVDSDESDSFDDSHHSSMSLENSAHWQGPISSSDDISSDGDAGYMEEDNLTFVLGPNAENITQARARFNYDELDERQKDSVITLAHFTKDQIGHPYTIDTVVTKYVERLKEVVNENSGAKNVRLVGHSMGGAILTAVLERALSDKDFEGKSFELCADRTFTDLWSVTSSRGGSGFLYVAGPLLSLLGWNINPHKAMENIIAKYPERDIKIYINTAKDDEMLGAGKLRGDNYASNGNVKVFSRVFAGLDVGSKVQHLEKDDKVNLAWNTINHFKENNYFEDHYKACLARYNKSYPNTVCNKYEGISGITDRKGFAARPVVRALLQQELAKELDDIRNISSNGSWYYAKKDLLQLRTKELEHSLKVAKKTYTRDRRLEDAKDTFYPIDKLIFALGLAMLASFNIFLVPLCGFLFAAMFFGSNTYQEGLFSKLNIGFMTITLSLAMLTVFGFMAFAGMTMVMTPYIVPLTIVCSVALCINAVVRGYLRSLESISNVSKALNMNIDLCFELEKKIKSGSLSPEEKTQYERQLEVAKESFVMLSSEQENLVRTIKNPFDKWFCQIRDVKNRVKKIKKIPWESDELKSYLLTTTEDTESTMVRVLVRDVPWLIINIGMIAVVALMAVPPVTALLLPTAILILPVTPQLIISLATIAVACGVINFGLKLMYPKKRKVDKVKVKDYKSVKFIAAVLQGVGESLLYLVVNIMLTVFLAVALVARVLDKIPVPLIGKSMDGLSGFGSVLLAKLRSIAHDIIIPANHETYDHVTEYMPESCDEKAEKLTFILGRNIASVADTAKVIGGHRGGGSRHKAYILPHFDSGRLKGKCTAEVLADKYLEVLADYVQKHPEVTELKLSGADVGGAVLANTLEKVLADDRFENIKDFKLCIDESFTSLGRVSGGRGVFGFLYPAWPLLSLLGWNISPASSIDNILREHSLDHRRKVNVYISSSKPYGRLFGSGQLTGKSFFSKGSVGVYTQEKNTDVTHYSVFDDPDGFKEQNYFAENLARTGVRAEKYKGRDYQNEIESRDDVKITDKKAFADLAEGRAIVQNMLAGIYSRGGDITEEELYELKNKVDTMHNLYKDDRKLEEAKDKYYYPISKLIAIFGLIYLAQFNIIFVPFSALIFSLMYVYSITNRGGVYSRLNKVFMGFTVLFFALSCLGVVAFAVAPQIAPLIFLSTTVMSVLFLVAIIARSMMRSYKARTGIEISLVMNMNLCFDLVDKIDQLEADLNKMPKPNSEAISAQEEKIKQLQEKCAKNQTEISRLAETRADGGEDDIAKLEDENLQHKQDISAASKEINRLLSADPDRTSKNKDLYNKKILLQCTIASYKLLSKEQESLLSGVKSPLEKYLRQIPNMQRRIVAYEKYKENKSGGGQQMLEALDIAAKEAKYKTGKVFVADLPWLVSGCVIAGVMMAVSFNLLPVTMTLMFAMVGMVAVTAVLNAGIKKLQVSEDTVIKDESFGKSGGMIGMALDQGLVRRDSMAFKAVDKRLRRPRPQVIVQEDNNGTQKDSAPTRGMLK